jgi:hypothetical protein
VFNLDTGELRIGKRERIVDKEEVLPTIINLHTYIRFTTRTIILTMKTRIIVSTQKTMQRKAKIGMR